jgi:hypothetical protein
MQAITSFWSTTRRVAQFALCSGIIAAVAGCATVDHPYGLFSQTARFDDITIVTTWTSGLKVTDARMTRLGGISTAQISLTDPEAKADRSFVARATWYDERDGIVQPDLLFAQRGMLSPFNTATTVWKAPTPQARRVVIEFKMGD